MKSPRARVQVGDQLFGYRFGLRQFSRDMTITLPPVRGFAADEACEYLFETFEIPRDEATHLKLRPGLQIDPGVETFLASSVRVARHLMQYASIPSYEDDLIHAVKPAGGTAAQAHVSMYTPAVANMPKGVIQQAYDLGIRIAAEFTKPDYKRKELKALSDEAATNYIDYASRVGRGAFTTKSMLKDAFGRDVAIFHLGSGFYRLGVGSNAKVFSKSATMRDSLLGAEMASSKSKCLQFLKAAGLPVPDSYLARDANHARKIAEHLGFPLVVKPADRDRGEGVSMDITSLKDLDRAYGKAEKWSRSILVERRVPGICHRLVIFRDQPVFGFSRHPNSVIGDGESTIAALNLRERQAQGKKARHLKKKAFALDDLSLSCLAGQGLDVETVLEKDQIAYLRPYQVKEWGGYNEPSTDRFHPANVDLARRVARHFGFEMVGVDMISVDITRPWYETGSVINEVNHRPQVRENTTRAVLDLVFADATGDIPVDCFVGNGDALAAALARREQLASGGVAAFVTSHDQSFDGDGNEMIFAASGSVFDRVGFLAVDERVEHLIVVVQTDELLHRGRPVRAFDDVVIVNDRVGSVSAPDTPVDAATFRTLAGWLRDEQAGPGDEGADTSAAEQRPEPLPAS